VDASVPWQLERPDRLSGAVAELESRGLRARMVEVEAAPAAIEDVLRVHEQQLVDSVLRLG
jgi:acetoin utilization deacetylase AcuC-like enzyme